MLESVSVKQLVLKVTCHRKKQNEQSMPVCIITDAARGSPI